MPETLYPYDNTYLDGNQIGGIRRQITLSKVGDLYTDANMFITRVVEINGSIEPAVEGHFRDFYVWAAGDSIQLIADFDEDRDIETEYSLCAKHRRYRFMGR